MHVPRFAYSGLSRSRFRLAGSDAWASFIPRHATWQARKGAFFAVADSVGSGSRAGQMSVRAVEVAMRAYYLDRQDDPRASLVRAVNEANVSLLRVGPVPTFGGAAVCAVALFDGHVAVANVGDARVFLVRPPWVIPLTADHSWLATYGHAGETPAFRRHHPRRWDLARALGRTARIAVDVMEVRVVPGDTLVLCSDGVADQLTAGEIGAAVSGAPGNAAASALVDRADRAGADDCTTGVVIRVLPARSIPTPRHSPSRSAAFRLQPRRGLPSLPRALSRPRPELWPAIGGLAAAVVLLLTVLLS